MRYKYSFITPVEIMNKAYVFNSNLNNLIGNFLPFFAFEIKHYCNLIHFEQK